MPIRRIERCVSAHSETDCPDPTNPATFWINPYAMHFAAIKVSDLVYVDEYGNFLSETPHKVNTAGFVIHSKIHKARPDINAACHCHAPYSRAWSAFGKEIQMSNRDITSILLSSLEAT